MHYFYLQCPSHKHIDPSDVEHLLSLLESWAPASSLATFKLAWKTAILLALATAKYFSDVTLLCIDQSAPFYSASFCYFHSMSGGQTDYLGHIFPQIHFESHSYVNLCPVCLFEGLFETY